MIWSFIFYEWILWLLFQWNYKMEIFHRLAFNGQELELIAPNKIKICPAKDWAEKVQVDIHVQKLKKFPSMEGLAEDTNIIHRKT